MRKLRFHSLWIENFKTFTTKQQINFKQFGDCVVFLEGENRVQPEIESNGSGKSSIWHALSWCLYGMTCNKTRNPGIKPWVGDKHTRVACLFSIDGVKHKLVRTTFPNRLRLDGVDVSGETIEQLLGMNFDVFHNTIVLGQGRPLFFDLSPSAKMELFSSVLDLQRWDERSNKASEQASKVAEHQAHCSFRVSRLQIERDVKKENYKKVKRSYTEWKEQYAVERSAAERAVDKLTRSLEMSKKAVAAQELNYDGVSVDLVECKRSLRKAETKLSALSLQNENAKLQLVALRQQLSEAKEQVATFNETSTCPLCGKESTNQLEKHISAQRKKIKFLRKAIKQHKQDRDTSELEKVRDTVARLRDELGKQEEQSDKVRFALESAKESVRDLQSKYDTASDKLNDWQQKKNPYKAELRELREWFDTWNIELERLQDELTKADLALERNRYWVKGFRDIQLYIIEQLLVDLEFATNAVVEDIGLRGWKVKYAVEKEAKSGNVTRALNVTVLSPSNNSFVAWDSWSGGEAQRLRLAGALALSQVLLAHAGIEVNLEVLDEPTRHMSRRGTNDVCDYLKLRAQALHRQVWYVDHMSVESARFGHVVKVIKTKKKGSQVTIK